MKRFVPYLIILLELATIGLVSVLFCIFAIILFQRPPAPTPQIPIAAPVPRGPEQVALATLTPTTVPTPTSSPTPTSTPTPNPKVTVSSCTTIDSPGTYVLNADLTQVAAADCIRIAASQVTLDCDGHSLRGLAYNGSGIGLRKFGLLGNQVPDSVEVRNCQLSRFRFGIYVESGSRISIHDNLSSENYDDTDKGSRYGNFLGTTEGGGIRVNYATDSTIWNNTTMTQAIGIDVRFSNRVMVRDNLSSNNSAWGINFMRTNNSEISGNTAADNVRQCTWGAGVIGLGCDAGGIILQDGSNNVLVSGNQVIGKNGNGIFVKAHAEPCGNNNTIVGNTVVGALYNSIELSFCTGNKINNNTFRDGLDAIWLGFAHDNEIKDNVIENMRNHGIISSNSRNNMISGNRITNANEGLLFYSEFYDRNFFYFLPEDGDYTSHDNCLCRNVFKSNNIAIRLKDSAFNRVTDNDLRGNGRGILLQGNSKGNDTTGNQN